MDQNIQELTTEELEKLVKSNEEIARMVIVVQDAATGNMIRVPDLDKQREALSTNQLVATELNTRAVAKQNEEGKLMVCWAEPTPLETGNIDYHKFMHVDCVSGEPPEGWTKLLINDTIKDKKCMGCGYTLDRSNKDFDSKNPEKVRKEK